MHSHDREDPKVLSETLLADIRALTQRLRAELEHLREQQRPVEQLPSEGVVARSRELRERSRKLVDATRALLTRSQDLHARARRRRVEQRRVRDRGA